MKTKHLCQIVFFYIAWMTALLLFVTQVLFHNRDVSGLLLQDDGYYQLAGKFVSGNGSLFGNSVGPGMPLLYSIIYVFPQKMHFLARFYLTVFCNCLTLLFLFLFVRKLKNSRSFYLFTSLLFCLHPIALHWTIKSTVEPVMVFLFILFAYLVFRNTWGSWAISSLVFYASIFVRPTFLLIPIVIMVFAMFQRTLKLLVFGFLLFLLSLSGYWINNAISSPDSTNKKIDYSSGIREVLMDAYFVDAVMKSKHFNTGEYDAVNGSSAVARQKYFAWIAENAPKAKTTFGLILLFVRQNPRIVLKKILLNPIFFFSLSSTTIESLLNLTVNLLLVGFLFFWLLRVHPSKSEYFLLAVSFGYFSMFWICHGYARYAFGLLPFLSFFASLGIFETRQLVKNFISTRRHPI